MNQRQVTWRTQMLFSTYKLVKKNLMKMSIMKSFRNFILILWVDLRIKEVSKRRKKKSQQKSSFPFHLWLQVTCLEKSVFWLILDVHALLKLKIIVSFKLWPKMPWERLKIIFHRSLIMFIQIWTTIKMKTWRRESSLFTIFPFLEGLTENQ